MKRILKSMLSRVTDSSGRLAQRNIIKVVTIFAALIAYTGAVAADPGTGSTLAQFAPLQQDFCSTEGGQLLESFGGILVVVFFFGIVSAIMIAGAIEALPLTGWFNQIGFSMMGKIPIALAFVFVAFSMLSMVDGTFGLTAPSCVPIVG